MDVRERDVLVRELRTGLAAAAEGSRVELRGSLAAGTADEFSDVDLEWVVPDERFEGCVAGAAGVLGQVRAVVQVRNDPDYQHSDRRRLLFVRFAGLPLFWRLDLSIRAESVAGDETYDDDNPAARARDGEWDRPASALANAVGAIKAVGRERPELARGLLDRGFARIGEADAAGDGSAWDADIVRLAEAVARRDPGLGELAAEVVELAGRVIRR